MGNFDDIENRESVKPVSFEPIEGVFKSMVTSAEYPVPTKDGTGKMCKIVETILEGEHQGRQIFGQFNIVNKSDKAQTIGRGQLASLAQACGLAHIPDDSSKLLDKPHWIKVAIEASGGIDEKTGQPYAARSVIKAYYPLDRIKQAEGGSTGTSAPASAPQPAQATTTIDQDQIPF